MADHFTKGVVQHQSGNRFCADAGAPLAVAACAIFRCAGDVLLPCFTDGTAVRAEQRYAVFVHHIDGVQVGI